MSLSPFYSIQSRFVTDLLNRPRTIITTVITHYVYTLLKFNSACVCVCEFNAHIT